MLKKLWSQTGALVQSIEFHPGVNLIIGEYSGSKDELGINGIGKSSVVRLIDYLLLSNSNEKIFRKARYRFLAEQDHDVCLSMTLRSGRTLVIRRRFAHPNEVFLARDDERERPYTKAEAAQVLESELFQRNNDKRLPGHRYRSLMPFFVKDDLDRIKQVDPIRYLSHQGVNAYEVLVLNLFLLGLPTDHLVTLMGLIEEESTLGKKRTHAVESVEELAGKPVAELSSELHTRRKDLKLLEEALGELYLQEDFAQVSGVLAHLSEEIGSLRREANQANRQLAKIRRYTAVRTELDVDTMSEYYALASDQLGQQIRRTLNEVMSFRRSLSEERLKFHGDQISKLTMFRDDCFERLDTLEKQRAALLRSVGDGALDSSMKSTFERFARQKVQVERIGQLVDVIADLRTKEGKVKSEAGGVRFQAMKQVQDLEDDVAHIRERFLEIVSEAISSEDSELNGAYFDVTTDSALNRPPVHIEIGIPRADALGMARLKIVAYDLTVLLHGVSRSLANPSFLIHDGAFHGMATQKRVRTLNYLDKQRRLGTDFQYIATFNKEELAMQTTEGQAFEGLFSFDINAATVLTLTDDPQQMLFKRAFS